MSEVCVNLACCPFVKYCEENNAITSVKGFIHMYCVVSIIEGFHPPVVQLKIPGLAFWNLRRLKMGW